MESSRVGRSELATRLLLILLLVVTSALVIERVAFDDRPMGVWAYFSVVVWGGLALGAAYRLATGRIGDAGLRAG